MRLDSDEEDAAERRWKSPREPGSRGSGSARRTRLPRERAHGLAVPELDSDETYRVSCASVAVGVGEWMDRIEGDLVLYQI